MKKYVLALDQGTTSSRAILFDSGKNALFISQKEFTQIFPKSGWVEHNPEEIWQSQSGVMNEVLEKADASFADIAAIGITNQRETTIIWDKRTGKPIYNAIVWQCRRTADIVESIEKRGLSDYIKKVTGLIPDAYFSATKIMWILENVLGARALAENGDLLFGTVDTWLLWKLTGGMVHATDYTNASRTMLYNINTLEWDERLLSEFNIPSSILPAVFPSGGVFGYAEKDGVKVPVSGIAGDQQAALFAHGCINPGMAKCTYGTGCFILMNTGLSPFESKNGLLSTISAGFDSHVSYALEGSVFSGGAAVQWLRDEMGFLETSAQSEALANAVTDTGGVYMVPAFTGLGAPYWDMYARGCIVGITRSTNKNHIIRACLEAIAFQVSDLIAAMEKDTGKNLENLKVDGGASANNFLMQFQSDILDKKVIRPAESEITALGAALLAGVSSGFWTYDEICTGNGKNTEFLPAMEPSLRQDKMEGWHKAVSHSFDFAKH